MTTGAFVILEENIRGEYELQLLSGLLNIFPKNNKGKRVMWNIKSYKVANISRLLVFRSLVTNSGSNLFFYQIHIEKGVELHQLM